MEDCCKGNASSIYTVTNWPHSIHEHDCPVCIWFVRESRGTSTGCRAVSYRIRGDPGSNIDLETQLSWPRFFLISLICTSKYWDNTFKGTATPPVLFPNLRWNTGYSNFRSLTQSCETVTLNETWTPGFKSLHTAEGHPLHLIRHYTPATETLSVYYNPAILSTESKLQRNVLEIHADTPNWSKRISILACHSTSLQRDIKTPCLLVRKRTITPERPPLVDEFSVNFCG
jgi:hypothetical protein